MTGSCHAQAECVTSAQYAYVCTLVWTSRQVDATTVIVEPCKSKLFIMSVYLPISLNHVCMVWLYIDRVLMVVSTYVSAHDAIHTYI